MKRSALIVLALLAALAAVPASFTPADAAAVRMCAPSRTGAALGPSQWAATSSVTYSLNARGCARIQQANVGAAIAAGFSVEPPFGSVAVTGITTSASGNFVDLPAGTFISAITVEETSGTNLAGGIKVGTTNGSAQVVSALGLLASSVATTSSTLIRASFSRTVDTRLYLDCVSCVLNNSSINMIVVYGYFN